VTSGNPRTEDSQPRGGAEPGRGAELDAAIEAHARRAVAGDAGIRADLAPGAEVEPPDLFDRLLGGGFRDFDVVAHARIGAYHLVKTRYRGPTTLVVLERWVRGGDGPWRVHEASIVRVAAGDAG
jgi:hypothetical protein